MNPLLWGAITVVVVLAAAFAFRRFARVSLTRAAVLEEVRRRMRDGVVKQTPGRGPQARGRLGQLEITVDLHHDPRRPQQSPMWRVLAVGPVHLERPVEVRTLGWQGWIDPWMELYETRTVPTRDGHALEVHSDRPLTAEHPVLVATLRQGVQLGAGSLHVRTDLMRAEIRFEPRVGDNRSLHAFLEAMTEISDAASGRTHRDGVARLARGARVRVFTTHE